MRKGVAMAVCWVALAACSSVPEEKRSSASLNLTSDGAQTHPSEGAQTEPLGERRSPQALVVRWLDAGGSQRLDAIRARITNTTERSIDGEIVLATQAPDGSLLETPVAKRTFLGREAFDMTLPVADLPVQSVGVGTAVMLVARYDSGDSAIAGTSEAVERNHRVKSFGPRIYVTHEDGFGAATLRSSRDEARANGVRLLDRERIAVRDQRGGAASLATPLAERPFQVTFTLPADAPGSPSPPTADPAP